VELAAPIVPQMAGGKKPRKMVGSAAKEAAATGGGTIGNVLHSVSSIAGSLSSIPGVGAIASTVGWAADVGSGIASIFGWSKPESEGVPLPVQKSYSKYLATSDGVDMSYPLALRSDNKTIVTSSMTITDDDEMSFSFLKKVETLMPRINGVNYQWTAVQNANALIFSIPVGPQQQPFSYTTSSVTHGAHTVTYGQGPPFYYTSFGFNQWRGSFNVTLKFPKTDSHTGRLVLMWTPTRAFTTDPDVTTGQLSLRTIIDLSLCNEFSVNLPYLIPANYLHMGDYSGYLTLRVLNELRAPTICAQQIDVLLYTSGGDDLEYAVPITTALPPFSPQFGGESLKGAGGGPIVSANTVYAEHCIGEVFTSIKQFLNRYSPIRMNPTMASTLSAIIWPWISGVTYSDATTGVLSGPTVGGDPFSRFSPMYAFYRGGARVGAYSGTANMFDRVTAVLIPWAGGNTAIQLGTFPYTGVTNNWELGGSYLQAVGVSDSHNELSCWQVPYYNRTQCSFMFQNTTTATVLGNSTQPEVAVQLGVTNTDLKWQLLRSFKDEFQLFYFLGAPPVFISTT